MYTQQLFHPCQAVTLTNGGMIVKTDNDSNLCWKYNIAKEIIIVDYFIFGYGKILLTTKKK